MLSNLFADPDNPTPADEEGDTSGNGKGTASAGRKSTSVDVDFQAVNLDLNDDGMQS